MPSVLVACSEKISQHPRDPSGDPKASVEPKPPAESMTSGIPLELASTSHSLIRALATPKVFVSRIAATSSPL